MSITEVPSVQKLNSNFECLFGISVELHEHKCFKTLLGVQEPSLLAESKKSKKGDGD